MDRTLEATDPSEKYVELLLQLAEMSDARDPYQQGHSSRVARGSKALALRLGYNENEARVVEEGALLRDLGMLKIPLEILHRHGQLTQEEVGKLREHTVLGEEMCRDLPRLSHLLPIIRHHHEQPDGKGYPDGLKGDAIPREALLVAVVDVFDSLLSDRPYRRRLEQAEAVAMLRKNAARGWLDSALVEGLLAMVAEEGWYEIPSSRPAPR